MKVYTKDDILFKISLDFHIESFKSLQIEHDLFLDLKDEDIEEKYRKTYPQGTNYRNFLYMICDMTSQNKVIIDKIFEGKNINK